MTKQHIFPNWMSRSEIAARSSKVKEATNSQYLSTMQLAYDENKKLAFFTPKFQHKVHQGNVLTRKLRKVCVKCNNEWMSDIENETKEIILSLQAHEFITLSIMDLLKLSNWIVLITIVAEFTDIPNKKIPVEERVKFYQERKPLDGWQIWIGKYRGSEWDLRYKHDGLGFRVDGYKPGSLIREDLVNYSAQSSIFVIGGLVIWVVSPGNGFDKDYFSSAIFESMQKIWPLPAKEVAWVDTPINQDNDVNFMSQMLANEIREFTLLYMKKS